MKKEAAQGAGNLPVKRLGRPPGSSGLWVDFKRMKLDGRTKLAQSIRFLKEELIKYVGGAPSIVESILIDRAVHKTIKAHIYETNFFSNEDQGSKEHYLALVNSLRLDLQALGLSKKTGSLPALTDYLEGKKGIE
jgi:hypothetical protein